MNKGRKEKKRKYLIPNYDRPYLLHAIPAISNRKCDGMEHSLFYRLIKK